ncbi:hypothetical protein D9M71_743520 [compost metagenome]
MQLKSLTEEANEKMSPEERAEEEKKYEAEMFKRLNDIDKGVRTRPPETLVWISGGPKPTVTTYEI